MNDLETTAMVRATEFRRSLGLSPHAPLDVLKLLRECLDVSFVMKPLSPGVSGIFLRLGATEIVVLNTAKSFGHQRFTAAHEYFHLKYDRGMARRVCVTGVFEQKVRREREADYFAANLLLPAEGIALRLHQRADRGQRPMSLVDLLDLEQHFGVSHAATLFRLRQLGYLTPQQVEELGPGVIAAARINGYDTRLYQATNEDRVYSSYAGKAKRALDEGLITSGKHEQLLLEAGFADLLYGQEEVDGREDV